MDTYKWYRMTPFRVNDAGDVGGDEQVGPAYSVAWQRVTDAVVPQHERLTVYFYASQDQGGQMYVQEMVELIIHKDPADPVETEINSDYHYIHVDAHGLNANELAVALIEQADRYGDPEAFRDLLDI